MKGGAAASSTTKTRRVLVVDDERDLAESCAFFLKRAGFEVELAFSGEDALANFDRGTGRFDLVLTDLKMPGMTGIELLREIKRREPDTEVVVITGYPELETAVEAMRIGALDYLTKPFQQDALMQCVEKALAFRGVRQNNQAFGERLRTDDGRRLVSDPASVFAATVATIELAARSDASVLIQGESGTGKELLAHHLHDSSDRTNRPFVPVDCATMPENLVESELFGHVRGAFSGAESHKMGLFQVADHGTLFLDEIGELPLAFQAKLLRAIQERQIRRVGGVDLVSVDVRIVAATNRDLAAEIEAGRFRADLFYRLDVVRIDVPPLRERPLDVEPLAIRFLAAFCEHNAGCMSEGFSRDAMAAMQAYDWPGNVRQLKNVVDRACALGAGQVIGAANLPEEIRLGTAPQADGESREASASEPFQEMKARKLAAIESSYLVSLLERHGGNVTRCAAESGMSRSAFQKIMKRYSIRSRDYRADG